MKGRATSCWAAARPSSALPTRCSSERCSTRPKSNSCSRARRCQRRSGPRRPLRRRLFPAPNPSPRPGLSCAPLQASPRDKNSPRERRVTLRLANPIDPSSEGSVEVLVDTGALFSYIPADLLTRLGIAPTEQATFQLADGRRIERPVGEARFFYDGKQGM